MMRKKIHYHSDCPFFAGCENMLANFWSSADLRRQYDVSFSYSESDAYNKGFATRVKADFSVYPLPFLDLLRLPFFMRWMLVAPLLIYQVWVLSRLLSKLRPDIVHVNNGGYPAALSARAAAIAARLAGCKSVVMVVNNHAADYARPNRWLGCFVDRLVVRSVSQFVTGSKSARDRLRTVLRLEDNRCIAIPNGIALRVPTETPEQTLKRLALSHFDGVIFGVVAILRHNKGHQVLLEAMAKLSENAPEVLSNIKLLIEGDGPLRQSLQTFVARRGLSEYCIFVGVETNIMNLMTQIDVLVLPSIGEEDFPNVILEAMGLGKPVIATSIAGTPEQIVDGKTGLLVRARNCDDLAKAIVKLGQDERLRREMGNAGLSRFREHFRAEVAVDNYLALYRSLTGG